jgi:hypothetical protein
MDRLTTLRSTIAANVSSPKPNPRSLLRRAGALAGALAFAAVVALGTSTPAFADEASWSGLGGAHDQLVQCNFQTHTVFVEPYARAMDSFKNGQYVASRIWLRDVTTNGKWLPLAWQTTFVNTWHWISTPILGGGYWLNSDKVLPTVTLSATTNHTYSVYVEYDYANANSVWTWDDMHATSTYQLVTANGTVWPNVTTCQAGF